MEIMIFRWILGAVTFLCIAASVYTLKSAFENVAEATMLSMVPNPGETSHNDEVIELMAQARWNRRVGIFLGVTACVLVLFITFLPEIEQLGTFG